MIAILEAKDGKPIAKAEKEVVKMRLRSRSA